MSLDSQGVVTALDGQGWAQNIHSIAGLPHLSWGGIRLRVGFDLGSMATVGLKRNLGTGEGHSLAGVPHLSWEGDGLK